MPLKSLSLAIGLFLGTAGWGGAQTPTAPAATFPLQFGAKPSFHVTLDRPYEATTISDKDQKKDLLFYLITPKEDGPVILFGIGKDNTPETEESIAQRYEGAKVTKIQGQINGNPVEWWRWEDSEHHYSSCYFKLKDADGNELSLSLFFTAGTTAKLAILETAFSKIDLQ